MRKLMTILLIAIAFTFAPVAAQEVTPEPTSTVIDATPIPDEVEITVDDEGEIDVVAPEINPNYPVIDPAAIVATIVNAVSGLVLAAFGTAPVTVVLVALLKKIPALDEISAPTMTFATASVLYIGAIIASVTGYTPQFSSLLETIAVIAPVIVSFIATLIGAPAIHNAAARRNVALIGDSRTPPTTFVTDGSTIYAVTNGNVSTDLPRVEVN